MKRRHFTVFEDNFIRCTYLFYTTPELARLLNRPVKSVFGRIKKLGLIIPPEIKRERHFKGFQIGHQLNVKYRFPKGHTPANKGKKMDPELKKRIQHTFFQPGHKPVNTLHDGAISVRNDNRGVPQKLIRISLGKWEYLSRYTYRQHNGDIPPGMVVAFRDRNTLNCSIENLYLLSKKENMLRNQIHQYPDDLKQVIHTISKLTKQIKRYAEK